MPRKNSYSGPAPPSPAPPSLSHAELIARQAHDDHTANEVARIRYADENYRAEAQARSKEDAEKPSASLNPLGKLKTALTSYKKGVDRVPRTGPAVLHEGEAVLNKEDAAQYRAEKKTMAKKKATEVLGGAKKSHKKGGKKGGKKVHRMHIRHAANGGYIAEHEYKHDDKEAAPPQNDEFQLGDMGALQNHVAEHMDQSQQQPPEEAQGTPAAAAPPPSPAQQPGLM